MARSKKKNPFWSDVCYFSNKKSRTFANQCLRTETKRTLKKIMDGEDPDTIEFKQLREVSDVWNFDSDGLPWYHDLKKELIGKYHDYYENFKKKVMRK